MSGFELERQSLSEKLTRVTEVSKRLTGDEMNRELLRNLQQSSDIVRDLWALYSDRPYVYARVMQQLGKVMGKAQLRKIHNDVLARSKAAAESAQKTLKPAQKPASKQPAKQNKQKKYLKMYFYLLEEIYISLSKMLQYN